MGIKVQCSDGLIEIGGDFNHALAMVKAISGRKYDSSTKIWTVPVEMKSFDSLKTGLPVDVLSGNQQGRFQSGGHQTRYGNTYSRNEWDAFREGERAATRAGEKFGDLMAEVEAKFRQQLADLGLSPQVIKVVLSYDFDDLVEAGKIQFSSEERRQKIEAIRELYSNEMYKITMAEVDAQEAAREQVYDKYGLE